MNKKVFSYANGRSMRYYWEVSISRENFDDNRDYEISKYKYIRKEASDGDNSTADSAYTYDMNANGHKRSFERKELVFINNDTFRFGKYVGRKIKDVKDSGYTAWYWKQIKDSSATEHVEFVKQFLEDYWYEFRKDASGEEYIVSPESIKREKEAKEKKETFSKKLEKDNEVILNITHWPNDNGDIKIDGITYRFPKVNEYWYAGYPYYMPVTNGKAKRIKGKTIKAHIMEFDDVFYIANFEILK